MVMTQRFFLFLIILALPVMAGAQTRDHGQAALGWINSFRAAEGRAPLSLSAELTRAAAGHAKDMARKGFLSHTGSDGSDIGQRAKRAGYRFCFIAENIAKGQGDVSSALQGWAKSAGHRRNMLAREANEVALVEGPGRYWVMVLGRAGC